jgi:hypothetical protein
MICNDNDTSLLCIVNYLVSGNTGYDINENPDYTLMLYEKTKELVKSINSFFVKNTKLQRWRDIFRTYIQHYDDGKTELSSNVADTPPYKKGETDKYVTVFHRDGNIYYKKNPDGSVDHSKIYTSPPEGGSHKRYRKSRKSRKYQSRRKSRRQIRKRVRTHRHKLRKSRK